MRKFFTGLLLLGFFVSNVPAVYALDEAQSKKLEAAGKKMKDLVEKYKKKELEKYNEVNISIKDTDGNPRDCTVRLYYNDYKQERFATSGGSFNSVFNHGESIPTELYSVAVYDCPCYPIKIDVNGPTYPGLSEEVEKIKEVILDEIEGEATKKITKEMKAQMEKAMTKVFDGMGHAGATWAKRFMSGVSVGMDLGKPFKDFFDKEIAKLFDAFLMQDERRDKLLDEKEPKNSNRSIVKEEWSDYLARKATGSATHAATTKYDINVLLRCPKNHKPKEFYLDWKRIDRLPPITKPDPKVTPPPVHTGERQETEAEYAERVKNHNEEEARKAEERAAADKARAERRAKDEAERKAAEEAKAKAEAAAQAKAEQIAKECKKCETIKDALDAKRGEYEQAWDDLGEATTAERESGKTTDKAKKAQTKAEAKRDNFNKPGTDYVESNGRRIDATDLELRDAAAQAGWERYRAGELTASELSDYWSTLDGDAIDALRAKVKADLEAAAKDAKDATEKAEKAQKEAEAKTQAAQEDLNKKAKEKDALENAYKDCLKKCQDDKKVNVLQDYGVVVTPNISPFKQWFPWNWNEDIIFETTIDPSVINTVPDYSAMTYDLIIATPEADKAAKPILDFHSVLDEISTGPILVNHQQIGQTGRLINVSAPTNDRPNRTGGFEAALQILLDDGTTLPDVTFRGMELYQGPEDALSDEPEATSLSPGGNTGGVNPGTNFVLEFSKPMDTATVEDSFVIRSFDEEELKVGEPSPKPLDEGENFGGDIWDKNQFDIDWNSDDTQATFTFNEERAAQPPKKRTIIIIIIIDRRSQQTGLVGGPLDFFELPDGAINDGFLNAPPLADPLFTDGFESGDTSAWSADSPDDGGSSLGDGRTVTDHDGFLIDDDISDMIPDFDPNPKDPEPKDDFLPEDPDEEDDDDLLPGEERIVCPDGEYRSTDNPDTDICSGQCGGDDSHCVATTPGCGRCVSNCPTGEYSTQGTCSTACVDGSKCVPSGNSSFRGQSCWSCLVVPIEFESKCLKRGAYETNRCGGFCDSNQECVPREDGCFSCQNKPQPVAECPGGSFEKSSCSSCDAGCEAVPNTDNLACYKCKEPAVESCVPSCSGKVCGSDGCGGTCGMCDSGQTCTTSGQCENDAPTCSAGSTPDISQCNEQCGNGACNDSGGGCYSCLQCDSGSFSSQSACEAGGSSCSVGGSQGNLSCWVPQLSCADKCSQNGFSSEPIDFTSQVESQLNSVSCVSSYSMQIQQASVGDCTCYVTDPPSITFNTTPPVCGSTVCGDVGCGESLSCATGENQTTTVTCNWGGWQKEDQYQYVPLLGGQ